VYKYTIIIPVFNEEKIIISKITSYISKLKKLGVNFMIIVSENGSTDNTKLLLKKLKNIYKKNFKYLTTYKPNYGLALKKGILASKGDFIICEELDICDISFFKKVKKLLENDTYDVIVGSKNHRSSKDLRPTSRRITSKILMLILRYFLNFKGTDTHGLKAFNNKIKKIILKTKLDKDMFATELVIRASNSYLRYFEVPIILKEIRSTPIALYKRILKASSQILKLIVLRCYGKLN
tara:strand:- start:233 stop:943 length:711 start_codon:yes stop_codon:yes gene_type:complete